ncbi:MAG TPA: DUF418 domain-containing protein [Longimicrobiales bacterium]|nr:DUF418 domain-containing protein [Longimicrobiales bacterium]
MSAAIAESPDLLRPVAPSERVELIDILRGFALLGILVVNFTGDEATRLDRAVTAVLDVTVSESFLPIFSFLFGLGFAVQLLRARERGVGVVNLYLRRMLALFLIGTFHAVVISNVDILKLYALLGLLLIPIHRLRDRWLWVIVAIPLVLGLWKPQVQAFTATLGSGPDETSVLQQWEIGQRESSAGIIAERHEIDPAATRLDAYGSTVVMRWRQYESGMGRTLTRNIFLNGIAALFVVGLIVGRRRILEDAPRHGRSLAIAATAGLTAAVAGGLVDYVVEPQDPAVAKLGEYGSNFGASVFYIALIALAVTGWPRVAALLRPFAAVGRLGLTNYLMQSIVMTLLFKRYGLALEEPSTTPVLLINLMFFFAIQVPFSRWWIARYRFGPAEWLWRTMTYGKRQPMRLASRVPAAQPPEPALVG